METSPHIAPGVTLGKYVVGEKIGVGVTGDVYRAERDGTSYAVKVIRQYPTGTDHALRVRKEAAALARLKHPGLVRLHEFGQVGGLHYLVLDLVEGGELRREMDQCRVAEARAIEIGRQLASALAEVHRHGMVHRDVKPENILVDRAGNLRLIDFGFARADGREANELVGTFKYAAPEQGKLRRPVDGRSDLYAVGGILFEALTGRPVFETRDVAALLHQHATVAAPEVSEFNPAVRATLVRIVAKLLRKDPDDRYQTARGLLFDLENIDALEADATKSLGARDVVIGQGDQIALVGREVECRTLRLTWEKTAQGNGGSIVLIEGEAGLGKSRLAREFIDMASHVTPDLLLLTGKCLQGEALPFGPLREAFAGLVRVLAARDERARALLSALGTLPPACLPLFVRFVKGLDAFIPVSDAPVTDAAQERELFLGAIVDALLVLARESGGLIFAIDDVQWIDESSLKVLSRLAEKAAADRAAFTVLTTARNDGASMAARDRFVRSMGTALLQPLSLDRLSDHAVRDLIRAHLGGKPLDESAVRQVANLAAGNPFAVGEYVRALLEGGSLRPTDDGFILDAGMNTLDLPQDVIALVMERATRLDPEATDILQTAAVLGLRFSARQLAVVVNNEVRTAQAITLGLAANLIEQRDADVFAFVHDRVHEATLHALSETSKREKHQAAADRLRSLDDDSVEFAFALARHDANGFPEHNTSRVFHSASRAGREALQSYANEDAFAFLERAVTASAEIGLADEQILPVLMAYGAAGIRIGKFAAIYPAIDRGLEIATQPLDRARLLMLKGNAKNSDGNTSEAWGFLQQALQFLGRPMPTNRLSRTLVATLGLVWVLFLTVTGFAFGRARGRDREGREILSELAAVGWWTRNFVLDYSSCLSLSIYHVVAAHGLGRGGYLVEAYAEFSMVLGIYRLQRLGRFFGDRAILMAEQLGDRGMLLRSQMYVALAHEYWGDEAGGERILTSIVRDIQKVLGSYHYVMCVGVLAWMRYIRGYHRESVAVLVPELPVYDAANNFTFSSLQRFSLFASHAVLGMNGDALRYREEAMRIIAPHPNEIYAQGARDVYCTLGFLEIGDLIAMEPHLLNVRKLHGYDHYFKGGLIAAVYGAIARYRAASGTQKSAARVDLEQAAAQLRREGRVPIFTCHVTVAEAVLAVEAARFGKAKRLLRRADRISRDADSAWGEFSAMLELARLHVKLNERPEAVRAATAAHALASRNGWVHRKAQVVKEFGLEDASQTLAIGSGDSSTNPPTAVSLQQMEALLEISVASASSLLPHEQATAALDKVVALLGAERAYLFLKQKDSAELKLAAGRDRSGADAVELRGYSTTVVNEVARTQAPVVVTGTEQGEAIGAMSIAANDLRSIMAAPLLVREQFLGVVYIDSRVAQGLFSSADLPFLVGISNHIALALETARAARLEVEAAALQRDLQLTAAVQNLFLPKVSTFSSGSVSVAGAYRPADECGGDWWWHEAMPGRVQVVLGDVTGHGVASAMVTAAIAASYRLATRAHADTPIGVMEILHSQIQMFDGRFMMTMACLCVEEATRAMTCVCAGSPSMLIMSHDARVEVVSAPGQPLGSQDMGFATVERTLAPGDRVFLYTDGVLELTVRNGRQLGLRGLIRLLVATRSLDAGGSVEQLLRELSVAMGSTKQQDDLTFVLVDIA